MKRWLPIFVSLFILETSTSVRAQTDAEVQARKDALEVAGAFSNDGFKIRDGHWCGVLKPHDHSLVVVNLYAGNQYWFSGGATEPVKKIAVSVYDESGKKVSTETYNDGEKAAAGFSPPNSGQYFVSVDLLEGEEGSFCLVCSYK
ncbi:MAG: hypothetical protein DME98_10015 [Verrucomicrobia bacterium]|jgi:hypothetical protein|nr:MAG: hypothetical protein DME98_10015 [Verrucomicrobiota bacterium]PYJ33523.1 MAG: hypothetical protein DME88_08100 [Verrucomicrobiota bacterium]